jgi:hypothetical protein
MLAVEKEYWPYLSPQATINSGWLIFTLLARCERYSIKLSWSNLKLSSWRWNMQKWHKKDTWISKNKGKE